MEGHVTFTNDSMRIITVKMDGAKPVGLLPGASIELPNGTNWSIL